ncbi:MAG: sugar ABC transporter permease [Lachnospiraceae bacterium]|nr:sugar ABC transporter permease [Lachnospiraceae bacterium]MBP3241803.1 sugar ABC transporter permease [Oribacterium sp.]
MTKKRSIWPFLLVAPATLIILCVVFVPVLNAFLMSFQNYDLRRPKDIAFIGLENYLNAFLDKQFLNAVLRTILWVIFGVGFQFFFGFVLALILNSQFRGRGFVRAVSMVPWVTPGVLIGLMWRWIYDGNAGVLNDVLMRLNIINDKIAFLSQKPTAFPSVIVTIVWQGIPFFALMLLAALQGVSTDMYEAAEIDGASRIQRLFYITIPSIKNTIFVTGLLRIIWVANSVDVIFNMTEGGPAYSTQTLSVYIYNKANALNLGYASAMAICLALLLLVVVVPYLRMNFKEEK